MTSKKTYPMYKPSGEPLAPVSIEAIENNRRTYAARIALESGAEKQVIVQASHKKKPDTLSPMELRKYILSQKNARPLVVPLTKTWEATKPCVDNEDTVWKDPIFRSMVIGICRNSCEVVLECLQKDRSLGGEEGIRAGMTQDERQRLYDLQAKDETKTILSDFADATYVARVLMSQSVHG